MKRYKKDRFESPESKRRKNKAKKKRKEKKLKTSNSSFSDNNLKRQSDYYSCTKKPKAISVRIHQYLDKNNISKESSYVLKNHSMMKGIQNSLPIKDRKKSHSPGSTYNLTSLKKRNRIKMTKSLLHSNFIPYLSKPEKTFNFSEKKKRYSIPRKIYKSRSRSNGRSRSISRSRFNLYYCKSSSNKYKRRSISNDKYSFQKRIFSCKYKESMSADKSFKISYSRKKSTTPDINFNRNRCSKVSEEFNNKLTHQSKQLRLSYLSLQKHYDRYTDILHEVKKILKKDAISKRKLKYILKRQRVYLHTSTPYVKLQSSSENEFYIPENDLKADNFENQMKFKSSYKCFRNGLTTKTRETLDKICISPTTSIIQESKVLYSKTSLHNKNLTSSTFISNISAQSNITSRTPSPALPLVRDEAVINKSINKMKLNQLSVKEINLLEKQTKFDSKICHQYENCDKVSNCLNMENNLLNTSSQIKKSSSSCNSLNPLLSKQKENLNLSNKNDINLKQTFSFYRLSSSSESIPFSQSLTPFKKCSDSRPWSQIFLLQNNTSNLLLKEDIKYSKNNKEIITESIQSSNSKTSSESELSKSKTSHLKNCLENLHGDYKTRSRSISFSKKSRSLSRSISRNSEGIQKRSCSKGSTNTFISSTKRSHSSYSCSSRSTIFSSRISRPPSSNSTRSRSTSIPRRYGSPSFLDRRRITSARKRPVPYHRPTPSPLSSKSSQDTSNYSVWSPYSNRSSRATSCGSSYLIS